MSINVEMVGQTLMIQHYVAEVRTPALCRMVSTSDAFTPSGRTRVQVIWTLSWLIFTEWLPPGSLRTRMGLRPVGHRPRYRGAETMGHP